MPNTRLTSFECTYNLIDYGAKEIATLSSSSIKSFCDINDLHNEPINYSYMTLEQNYSILDGSLNEFPNSFETPFFSNSVSDNEGTFETNPSFNITFSTPQTMFGLTLNFEKDYPIEIKISWLDFQNNLHIFIANPNKKNYVAAVELIDCVSILVEFTKTIPNRYIKLLSIVYGQVFEWTENEIHAGNLLLEDDIIGDKVSINELTFKVVDKDNSYNLANDNGLHKYFQKRQEAIAYELVNGTRINLGTYFLDKFSVENNLVNLKSVSYMGLLDNVQYNDGTIYNGELAGNILEDIFEKAEIEDYLIDTITYNTQVYGTLKPMTCRDALREILFACSSIVDTTSSDGIVISKVNNTITNTLYRSHKINTKITRNDYVYGVEIEYPTYTLLEEKEDIITEQEYSKGESTILFNDAYDPTSVEAFIITGEGDEKVETPISLDTIKTYYCTFNLENDSVITIRGNKYEEKLSTTRVVDKFLQAGESATIEQYEGSLLNGVMAKEKAQEILTYLQNRLALDVQHLANDIEMNGRKWVENPSPNYANFIAWYESRDIDLTGGFVDNAKLVGYYYSDYNYYYARENDIEIYAGEELGECM